jgi:excisionase family DNA binding protein
MTILDDPLLASSRVVTPKEATAMLRCGMTHLYELLENGALRSYKDGSKRRIYVYSILQYQARQEGKAA